MDNKTVLDDIKKIRDYALGAITFATASAAFLVTVFNFDLGPTVAAVAGLALISLVFAYLIERSNTRQMKALEQHKDESDEFKNNVKESLAWIKEMTQRNHESSIRLEMNSIIRNHPENHDTILKYAERYFLELGADWTETDIFLMWVEEENAAGRPVHISPALLANVKNKKVLEDAGIENGGNI